MKEGTPNPAVHLILPKSPDVEVATPFQSSGTIDVWSLPENRVYVEGVRFRLDGLGSGAWGSSFQG